MIDKKVYSSFKIETTFKNNSRMDSSQDSTSIAFTTTTLDHRLQPSPVKEVCQSSQDGLANPSSPLMSASLSPKPPSPSNLSESNPVKRVRKLKKRKCLKKAKGNEQPDISESELDLEQPAVRPTRKSRPHLRSSDLFTSPPTPEKKDKNDEMVVTEASNPQPQGIKLAKPSLNEANSDSSDLEIMDLPPPMPTDFVNLDSSDPDEMPEKAAKEPATMHTTENHAITDPQNLACNEVTSTSEIGTSSIVKAIER